MYVFQFFVQYTPDPPLPPSLCFSQHVYNLSFNSATSLPVYGENLWCLIKGTMELQIMKVTYFLWILRLFKILFCSSGGRMGRLTYPGDMCRPAGWSPYKVSIVMLIRLQLINFPYCQISWRYFLTLLHFMWSLFYRQLALLFIQTVSRRLRRAYRCSNSPWLSVHYVLVQCAAVISSTLLTIFKSGPGNIFLPHADTPHAKRNMLFIESRGF